MGLVRRKKLLRRKKRQICWGKLSSTRPPSRSEAKKSSEPVGSPADILEWIYDLKLFKLIVPEEFAGRPTPLPDMLRVFDELSAIDGSLGWLVHIGAAGGFFVPSFAKETARELFSPRDAVIAGTGFPAGRAGRVQGGYHVSGRWFYASGAQYASLFTAIVPSPRRTARRSSALSPFGPTKSRCLTIGVPLALKERRATHSLQIRCSSRMNGYLPWAT